MKNKNPEAEDSEAENLEKALEKFTHEHKQSFVYKLFKYNYTSHCQGSEDRGVEYALMHVPMDASPGNCRSVLFTQRNRDYYHEIDIESVEDLTIQW